MKRISYLINDRLGFEKHMEEEQLKQIKGFSAYYTLEENEKGILYCLEDLNGNKLNINSLNGYEKMYMDECFDCFCKDKEISENYKDFIKILDNPREIKKTYNSRYKLFLHYAKENNIKDTTINYIQFIDYFSDEYERTYNKSSISNGNEFDEFLERKVLLSNEIKDEINNEDEIL